MRVFGLVKCLICLLFFTGKSEAIYPEVGKRCPDFVLRNIKYFPKKEAVLKDFKGKWLILDFWNIGCGACVASFPRISAMQKKFREDVQYMLVGIQDENRRIEPMYAKLREKGKFMMPCAFDSSLAQRWDIYTAPYIIVIDRDGIVQTITYTLDEEDMQGFLNGTPPRLPRAFRVHEEETNMRIPFNENRPFLVSGNGGIDSNFLFRSLISKHDYFEQPYYLPETIDKDAARGKIQLLGVSLQQLYIYAYYGVQRRDDPAAEYEPVLEVRDSTFFKYSASHNKNMFCYSLIVPMNMASKGRLQVIMQKDLESYFGYTATIEKRSFRYWRLVATEAAKRRLQGKGGKEQLHSLIARADFEARNLPVHRLIELLRTHSGANIVDATGITGTIDITLHCLLSDVDDVRRALQSQGMDLVPDEQLKPILVIREKP